MSVSQGSMDASSRTPCAVCGRAPTAPIRVTRNVGMVVLRRSWSYGAPLCRDHGSAIAGNWLVATLLMGWWGIISFFTNCGAIATDIGALRAAHRLAPAGSLLAAPRTAIDGVEGSPVPAAGAAPATLPAVSRRQLGLVGAGIVGFAGLMLVGAVFGPKSVGDLAVGDCFDEPSLATTISEVPHHPCTMAHTAEVFDVVTYAGTQAGLYPSEDAFAAFAASRCGPEFNRYTGGGGGLAASVDLAYMTPTSDGWAHGDHRVVCYLVAPSGQTLTQSLRAASQ